VENFIAFFQWNILFPSIRLIPGHIAHATLLSSDSPQLGTAIALVKV
jgi:hypothetical protein